MYVEYMYKSWKIWIVGNIAFWSGNELAWKLDKSCIGHIRAFGKGVKKGIICGICPHMGITSFIELFKNSEFNNTYD